VIRIFQKKSLVTLAIFGILFSGIQVAQAADTNATTDRYIISFSNDDDVEGESNEFRNQGIKIHATFKAGFKGLVGDFTQAQINDLKKNPKFLYAEKDAPVYANLIRTTAGVQAGATWGLDRIDQRTLPLSTTYSYTADGQGVTAYVIDTGILSTHTQFGGRVRSGNTQIADGRGTTDCNGHGTHVAGTIGGSTYGVAKAVSLVAVRVLDCTGSGTTSGVIAGIDWAVTDHQAGTPAVANLSLGGGFSQALNDAIQRLIADGVTVAVAAGNSNKNACLDSPSSAPNAITVGATDITDVRASFSSFGTCLDIFAPGVNITSSWIGANNSTLATISGTSMASPHVAGAAALLLEVNKTATPQQIRDSLVNGSTCGAVASPGVGSPNNLLATSTAPAFVCPPPTISSVTISANPRVGSAATATVTTSGTTPITLSYQWQIATTAAGTFTNIGSAITSSYTPVVADQGKFLKVVVGASNGAGAATPVTSSASASIQAAATVPATPGTPTVSSPSARTLSVSVSTTNNGGSAIQSFSVKVWSATALAGPANNLAGTATCTTAQLTLTCNISLTRAGFYAVTAIANNAVGASAESAKSVIVQVR
jgi:subtilisin family serine protease